MIDVLVKLPDESKTHSIVMSSFNSVGRFVKNILGYYAYRCPHCDFEVDICLKRKDYYNAKNLQ